MTHVTSKMVRCFEPPPLPLIFHRSTKYFTLLQKTTIKDLFHQLTLFDADILVTSKPPKGSITFKKITPLYCPDEGGSTCRCKLKLYRNGLGEIVGDFSCREGSRTVAANIWRTLVGVNLKSFLKVPINILIVNGKPLPCKGKTLDSMLSPETEARPHSFFPLQCIPSPQFRRALRRAARKKHPNKAQSRRLLSKALNPY